MISIITASLNAGQTIRGTLESIRHQTVTDAQHVVCDGGSVDATISILEEYRGAYDLTWVSEPDTGISDALNKGFEKSVGTYVLVIQADDRLTDESVLERISPLLRNQHYDICSFPVIINHPIYGMIIRNPIRALWWNRLKFIFSHQGTFVHRRVFAKIGGFREEFSIAMDYDFFYRALVAGCTVKFHRQPPVALMGGSGIGTRLDTLRLRLREEALVRKMNERNPIWRMGQIVFEKLYTPHKLWVLPHLKGIGAKRGSPKPTPNSD